METQQNSLTEDCKHCPHNPNATKPFLKTQRISIKDSFWRGVEKIAKADNKNPNCFICECVCDAIRALTPSKTTVQGLDQGRKENHAKR